MSTVDSEHVRTHRYLIRINLYHNPGCSVDGCPLRVADPWPSIWTRFKRVIRGTK